MEPLVTRWLVKVKRDPDLFLFVKRFLASVTKMFGAAAEVRLFGNVREESLAAFWEPLVRESAVVNNSTKADRFCGNCGGDWSNWGVDALDSWAIRLSDGDRLLWASVRAVLARLA
jgi:hypothetical protein